MTGILDQCYLPFTPEQLGKHFQSDLRDRHVEYYRQSADRYHEFLRSHPDRAGVSLQDAAFRCQIEKDERFWTATALMSLYHSRTASDRFTSLLSRAFGDRPPLREFGSWTDCFAGRLHLVLECVLPPPDAYVSWLPGHLAEQHFIPYVLYAAKRDSRRQLEGPTHVDALLLNEDNGFSVLVEAKVLSDASYQVSFDAHRNQLARSIDVMLESSDGLPMPLRRREPDATLFCLLTPQVFRDRPHSRLYGRLLEEYRSRPDALARDLKHRQREDWQDVADRLGWLTWEDCAEVLPASCPWLSRVI